VYNPQGSEEDYTIRIANFLKFLEGHINVPPVTSIEILYPMIRHALSGVFVNKHLSATKE
jgi:hypothetical protein